MDSQRQRLLDREKRHDRPGLNESKRGRGRGMDHGGGVWEWAWRRSTRAAVPVKIAVKCSEIWFAFKCRCCVKLVQFLLYLREASATLRLTVFWLS
jgi:hypothetical protein